MEKNQHKYVTVAYSLFSDNAEGVHDLLEQTKIKDNYNSEFKRRKFSLSEKKRNYIEYAIVDINEDYELSINEDKYLIFE
jgi:hypothetical protein